MSKCPSLDHEMRLWAGGLRCIAGLDEAGRGAWAGPVVAGAVVLPSGDAGLLAHLRGVRDSKQLTPRQRDTVLEAILSCARAWAIGLEPSSAIDRAGIVPATRQAMTIALCGLPVPVDGLLIDYLTLPSIPLPQTCLPKGDVRVLSIAAASVVAKVHRDRLMLEMEAQFPGYGFGRNKGYGTAEHRAALARLGPCAIHRRSFAPVREAMTVDPR